MKRTTQIHKEHKVKIPPSSFSPQAPERLSAKRDEKISVDPSDFGKTLDSTLTEDPATKGFTEMPAEADFQTDYPSFFADRQVLEFENSKAALKEKEMIFASVNHTEGSDVLPMSDYVHLPHAAFSARASEVFHGGFAEAGQAPVQPRSHWADSGETAFIDPAPTSVSPVTGFVSDHGETSVKSQGAVETLQPDDSLSVWKWANGKVLTEPVSTSTANGMSGQASTGKEINPMFSQVASEALPPSFEASAELNRYEPNRHNQTGEAETAGKFHELLANRQVQPKENSVPSGKTATDPFHSLPSGESFGTSEFSGSGTFGENDSREDSSSKGQHFSAFAGEPSGTGANGKSDPSFPSRLSQEVRAFYDKRLETYTVKINPPDLGKVKIILNRSGETIQVKIVAENQQAKKKLESRLGELERGLLEENMSEVSLRIESFTPDQEKGSDFASPSLTKSPADQARNEEPVQETSFLEILEQGVQEAKA